MKKNQLFETVHSVAVNSITLKNSEDAVRLSKKENSALAISVVNHFLEDDEQGFSALQEYLTDCFKTLKDGGTFGIKGVKTKSGADLVTLKCNGAARFFHRAFNTLDLGFKLSGYAPFTIKEEEIQKIKTGLDRVVEACQAAGLDIQAIEEIKLSAMASDTRSAGRRKEQEKALAKLEAQHAVDLTLAIQNEAIDKFLNSGLTVEDIQQAIQKQA